MGGPGPNGGGGAAVAQKTNKNIKFFICPTNAPNSYQ